MHTKQRCVTEEKKNIYIHIQLAGLHVGMLMTEKEEEEINLRIVCPRKPKRHTITHQPNKMHVYQVQYTHLIASAIRYYIYMHFVLKIYFVCYIAFGLGFVFKCCAPVSAGERVRNVCENEKKKTKIFRI